MEKRKREKLQLKNYYFLKNIKEKIKRLSEREEKRDKVRERKKKCGEIKREEEYREEERQ